MEGRIFDIKFRCDFFRPEKYRRQRSRVRDMLVADGADPEATLAAAVSLIADGQQLEEAITKVNLAKEVMALLLEHGADVNAGVGSSNQTSLMIAAFQGNVAVLELLLEAGADASLHGRDGLDALDTAIAVDRVRAVSALSASTGMVTECVFLATDMLKMELLLDLSNEGLDVPELFPRTVPEVRRLVGLHDLAVRAILGRSAQKKRPSWLQLGEAQKGSVLEELRRRVSAHPWSSPERRSLDAWPRESAGTCTNMCNYASDDDCDDGGAGAEYASCALGTDCIDCGPRGAARLPSSSALPPPHYERDLVLPVGARHRPPPPPPIPALKTTPAAAVLDATRSSADPESAVTGAIVEDLAFVGDGSGGALLIALSMGVGILGVLAALGLRHRGARARAVPPKRSRRRRTARNAAPAAASAEQDAEVEEEGEAEEEAERAEEEEAEEGPSLAVVAVRAAEVRAAAGQFAARRLVGEGGYGKVYRGDALPSLPPARQEVCAIKRMATRDALLLEVDLLLACKHRCVLRLWAYCDDPRAPCLVTPLMRGGNLEDRLMPTAAGRQRLAQLGRATEPQPLSVSERLGILRDVTEALVYLHSVEPGVKEQPILHRDVKPSNILLDEHTRACLADVGLAKQAQLLPGVSHITTGAVRGTPGLLDPLLTNGMQHSTLTDGYALGMTCLVTLVARPAVGLRQHCKLMLKAPAEPHKWASTVSTTQPERERALPDASAGQWPNDFAVGLMQIVCGLTEEYKEDRMPVPEALHRLRALSEDGGSPSGTAPSAMPPPANPTDDRPPSTVEEEPPSAADALVAASEPADEAPAATPAAAPAVATATDVANEPRLCVVCDERPRTVRFHCGHASCCDICAALVRAADGLCPTCREPLAPDDADRGAHVAAAATFEMTPRAALAPAPAPPPAPTPHDRGGGGGRRNGRGNGSRRGRGLAAVLDRP